MTSYILVDKYNVSEEYPALIFRAGSLLQDIFGRKYYYNLKQEAAGLSETFTVSHIPEDRHFSIHGRENMTRHMKLFIMQFCLATRKQFPGRMNTVPP